MALLDRGRLAVLEGVGLAIDLTRRIGGRCATSVTSCHALVAAIGGLVVLSTAIPTLSVPGVGTRGMTTIAVLGAGALAVAITSAIIVTYVVRTRWRCASALFYADRLTCFRAGRACICGAFRLTRGVKLSGTRLLYRHDFAVVTAILRCHELAIGASR